MMDSDVLWTITIHLTKLDVAIFGSIVAAALGAAGYLVTKKPPTP